MGLPPESEVVYKIWEGDYFGFRESLADGMELEFTDANQAKDFCGRVGGIVIRATTTYEVVE